MLYSVFSWMKTAERVGLPPEIHVGRKQALGKPDSLSEAKLRLGLPAQNW